MFSSVFEQQLIFRGSGDKNLRKAFHPHVPCAAVQQKAAWDRWISSLLAPSPGRGSLIHCPSWHSSAGPSKASRAGPLPLSCSPKPASSSDSMYVLTDSNSLCVSLFSAFAHAGPLSQETLSPQGSGLTPQDPVWAFSLPGALHDPSWPTLCPLCVSFQNLWLHIISHSIVCTRVSPRRLWQSQGQGMSRHLNPWLVQVPSKRSLTSWHQRL